MKKLLCVLMFGMVFGEVSQRVIDFTAESNDRIYLSNLFPDYDLEWAIISIINCSREDGNGSPHDCAIRPGFYGYNHEFNGTGYPIEQGNIGESNITQQIFKESFYIDFNYSNIEYEVKLLITAEFPEEDSGYIEEGFDYCLDVGANLVASPCRDAVPILDTLPSEIANNLTGIIGQGVAANNQNGEWQGSLNGLGGGNGYWFQSNVNACFNYNCVEN